MSMNKGFTLIETLFVLFVICILASLTLTLHLPQKKVETEIQEIVAFLNQAKLKAMVSKRTVTVQFLKSTITVSDLENQNNYQCQEHNYFDEYKMSFNENGHIKTAKTVNFHTPHQTYHFVYQVGSGYFYVE